MSHTACKPVGANLLGQKIDSAQDIARLSDRILFNSMDLLQAPNTWSGGEMALSDLLGKMLETPVWRLLGFDKVHPKRAYASTLFGQVPKETFDLAQDLRNQGSMAAKFGWGGFGSTTATGIACFSSPRRSSGFPCNNRTPSNLVDNIPTGRYVAVTEDPMPKYAAKTDARAKLLDAALMVIRTKGYSATTVDDLCKAAGVTKGAFFHHFKSKDELGVAAANHWSETTSGLFATAPYHQHADPLDRFLSYVDFRKALLQGGVPEFTCLVGTMVQESYETAPAIRAACECSIAAHAATLEPDIEAAMRARGMTPDWTARSLALHTQAVIQGAFILAKASGGAAIAADSIDHLRRYIEMLFGVEPGKVKARTFEDDPIAGGLHAAEFRQSGKLE